MFQIHTHDHREVEDTFSKLTAVTDSGGRRQGTGQITIELVRHSVAGEQHLYPAVRDHISGGDAIADEKLSDHAEAEHFLKGLKEADPGSADFAALTGQLIRAVNIYVKRRARLAPGTGGHASPADLRRLGEQDQAAMDKVPTRPRSSAPGQPPLNKLLTSGAALTGRIRGHLPGRGQLYSPRLLRRRTVARNRSAL